MNKQTLRQEFLLKRSSVTMDMVSFWSKQLSRQLWSLPEVREAQHIMAYLSMPKEANLDVFLAEALEQQKDIYVPVCINKTEMIGVHLDDLDDVERGTLGIRIPKKPYRIVDPHILDCVLVPGLAFDATGGRMGMGAGYYDRYLQQITFEKRIGIAWDNQLSEKALPMAAHDEWMHKIVTPSESIQCSKG